MKKVLKAIWNQFIYGGHLLALCPTIAVLISLLYLNQKISLPLLISIYLITYSEYLFDRSTGLGNDSSSERVIHYSKYKKIIPALIVISFIVSLFILYSKGLSVLLFAILLILVGVLYTTFLKGLTRYIFGFKSIYVSFMFGLVVFYVVYFYRLDLSIQSLILFLFFTLRWLTNTAFCDIKDISTDAKEKLKTIPVILGERKTILLLSVLNFLSILPLLIAVIYNIFPAAVLLLSLVAVYYQYILYLTNNKKKEIQYLCNVWADGECFVWLLLGLISTLLFKSN